MRRGAVGRVRTLFPGAIRSQRELSLALSVDLVTRRPPTYVGARDHRPTAFAAPRFIFGSTPRMPIASAARKDRLRQEALRRRGALSADLRPAFSARLAREGLAIA